MSARILIVEDEHIVQFDLQQRLERMGHVVVGLASRGEEAVAHAAELRPDLILMDVCLDGSMDGIEAARQIHSHQATPVIYITAFSGLSGSMINLPRPHLSKPFRTGELQSAIETILGED